MTNLFNATEMLTLQSGVKNAVAAVMLVLTSQGTALAQVAPALQVNEPAAIVETAVVQEETPVEPEPAPTVQDVLLAVCAEKGYGEDCAKHLLGMMWNESSNRYNVIGDAGKARGYFQIWTHLHKIPVTCAEDLVCSAQWSLRYMERNHYPKHVSYAVQCHNGCNINNGYAAKALRNGNALWSKPMEVTQAAPIVLPPSKAEKEALAKAEAEAEARAEALA